MKIEMVDIKGQYNKIKSEVDQAVISCISSSALINGPAVKEFQASLESYLGVKNVIPCANGTDSLQIAMMALELQPGDEVICPAFTYVATAEVIGLLGLTPIMVDVDPETFNLTASVVEKAITPKTKAIVPVHLYGQSCDMEPIMQLAKKHNLFVIEDNAQAIGAEYTFSDGTTAKTGTIGHIGSTSFFPSKNLGCYGDGGALMTNDDVLAKKMRMIANHGQERKYHHKVLGCNSRLDTIQAAILNIKLSYLDEYGGSRNKMASYYDEAFNTIEELEVPVRQHNCTHVFHQYTLKIKNGKRDELQNYLSEKGIPSMIYYPLPLYKQEAFHQFVSTDFSLATTEQLCDEVLSLPIHTEMNVEHMDYICTCIQSFFKNKIMENFYAHETAIVDKGCSIGNGTKIWHFSHILSNCTLGEKCNIGQNVVISPEVVLGKNVKVQNNVSIYTGVTCDDDVFLGPSMVFTNVINPRSAINRRDQYAKTHVGKGASIGANATIVCGYDIGEYAFIGAGAVVTKNVPAFALVVGNPARQLGWVGEYGHRLTFNENGIAVCPESQQEYKLVNNTVNRIK